MRWTSGKTKWHWRFAVFPTGVWMGEYYQWIWLEWYRVNAIGKVWFLGEENEPC